MRIASLFVAFLLILVVPLYGNAQQPLPSQKVETYDIVVDEDQAIEEAFEVQKVTPKDIKAIEEYLNGLTTVVSTFEQTAPDGSVQQGRFYLSRPGKLRWEYDPPHPITIIAKGSLLAYHDKELDQLSHVPIEESLSGLLTRKEIKLSGDIEVYESGKGNDRIVVTLIKAGAPSEGQLTLVFRERGLRIQKMVVLDPSGQQTVVEFTSSVFGKPLDSSLFKMPRIKKKR